jgi:hypothetical protein
VRRCGLIATDGGREATRAIADAMSLIERAAQVRVLIGTPPDADVAVTFASIRRTVYDRLWRRIKHAAGASPATQKKGGEPRAVALRPTLPMQSVRWGLVTQINRRSCDCRTIG